MPLSIIIVGSTTPESLEQSYARALSKLDCKVRLWNPQAALKSFSRGGKLGGLFSQFVHVEAWLRKSNLDLLALTEQEPPDLILVVGTSGVRAGTLAQIQVRLPRCLIYCIYPDSPHNLDCDRIHCLPFFDRITVSSPPWVDAFRKLGGQQVAFLPFAADTDLHQPHQAPASETVSPTNVAFIGTWRPEREAFLESLTEFGLQIWGSHYWRTRTRPSSALRACWVGRPARGDEFPEICANTKILLNVMDPLTWPGPNMRTFEQAACRGFTLTTRSPAVLELFSEGKTIACFDSIGEAKEKISHYLVHSENRRQIAENGCQFVIGGGHTYLDRARLLLQWVQMDQSA